MNDDKQMSVDEFLEMMGVKGGNEQENLHAFNSIMNTINIQVGKRIAGSLTDQQAEEFVKLSDDASAEELGEWMRNNVPNYNNLVQEETLKLRDDVMSVVGEVINDSQVAQN